MPGQLGTATGYHRVVRGLIILTLLTGIITACSATQTPPAVPPAAEVEPVVPQPTAPPLAAESVPAVSDRVPQVDELLELDMTVDEAECFISTIDPDGNGRMDDPDLFFEALACQ